MRCAVRVTVEKSAFTPGGGSGTLAVSTARECAWSARSEAAWVTLSSPDGQGEGVVPFTVASNTDAAGRSGNLVVNEQRVQIAQEGRPCEFTVSSNRETVEAAGGERTVRVRTNGAQCAWTAATNTPWITIISGREGHGEGTVRFQVGAFEGAPRTGTLNVAGHVVHVDQGSGCTYAVGTDRFDVSSAGGDRQVSVSAGPGCTWTAESDTAWITLLSAASGTGADVVAFRVGTTDGPGRSGTLRIAGRSVMVVQSEGCSLAVNPTSLNPNAAASMATVQVETAVGCAWSAAAEAAWLAVAPANGNGRAQIQVAVNANAGPARSGSVTIGGLRVPVAQASGCTFSVTPAAQQVPAAGGAASAAVSTVAGCAWTVRGAPSWITVTTPSVAGPGQAAFSVAPNNGPLRTGTLTIAGTTHSITQPSLCTWTFNPPSAQMEAAGGIGAVLVFVTGACTWTASSTVDWITVVTGASGTGGGMVQFTVAPNNGPARTGIVVIGGEKYVVSQFGR